MASRTTTVQTSPNESRTDSNTHDNDRFFWSYTEEPHKTRRQAIIKAHPEVGPPKILYVMHSIDLLPGPATVWAGTIDEIYRTLGGDASDSVCDISTSHVCMLVDFYYCCICHRSYCKSESVPCYPRNIPQFSIQIASGKPNIGLFCQSPYWPAI